MKKILTLLFLVLAILTGCKAAPPTTTDLQSDTTLQEFTHLIPASLVPEIEIPEGEKVRIKTPELDISLTRAGNYIAMEATKQVIRQKETETHFIPTTIKDKSQVTIHQNSHNSDKSKDKSKVKAEVNENSKNKEKTVSQNPLQLLLIFFVLIVGLVLFWKYGRGR